MDAELGLELEVLEDEANAVDSVDDEDDSDVGLLLEVLEVDELDVLWKAVDELVEELDVL